MRYPTRQGTDLSHLRAGQRPHTDDIRRKWDASEERYQQIMDRAAARRAEICPESYAAELDRDLEMLFPRRGVE